MGELKSRGATSDVLKGKKADLQAALTAMLEKGGDGSASIENTVAPDPAQEPLKEPEVETETEVIQDEVSISKEATENSSPVRDAAVYDESQQDGNQQDGNQQDGNQQDGNQR